MKTAKHLIALALVLITAISYGQNLPVKIKLSNIKNQKATIHLGVYRQSDDFPLVGKQSFNFIAIPNGKDTLTISLSAIPEGVYAIAIFQDLNNNGKLDTNFLGMPKEPYAFSQNYHPKLSKPTFDDCKIAITHNGQTMTIAMVN